MDVCTYCMYSSKWMYVLSYLLHRSTNSQLSREVEALSAPSLTSSTPPLSHIHSKFAVLVSRMGLELEALSRSVTAAQQHSDSLAYNLSS